MGWKLNEIKGWSCCRASQAQCVDPIATLVANARNIALAEEMRMPMLTTCSTCMLTLTKAKNTLDKGVKNASILFSTRWNEISRFNAYYKSFVGAL